MAYRKRVRIRPLSRFRLRLISGFAVAFFIGSAALEGASYGYVTWTNSREFNDRLKDAAHGLRAVVRSETGRVVVDSSVLFGLQYAMADYRPSGLAFVVYDSSGAVLASGGDSTMARRIPRVDQLPDVTDIDKVPLSGGLHLRYADDTIAGHFVVAAATTDVLRRTQRRFQVRILFSMPLALIFALTLSYYLMRYALAPIEALGRAAAEIDPDQLEGRLPVYDPPDEIDQLAAQFNVLLDRIQGLQAQSRRFLREVAHQIRTPLTLVLGEAELGLERTRSPDEYIRVLRRVHSAAGQMTHRVQDLLLLARMEAGERPPLRDAVELDLLALEMTDLFRGRATSLGQHLELQDVAPCEVAGDEALLREALLEMLENACRHGDADHPVVVSVRMVNDRVSLEVRNSGAPIATAPRATTPDDESGRVGGLGLSIMRWIAAVHHGEFVIRRAGEENVVALELPVGRPAAGARNG